MTPKLHELTDDYVAFSEMLEATEDPDASQELALALTEIRGGWLQKADNIVALISEFENNAEAIDNQIERMKARKRRSESRAAWLRKYLLQQLEFIGRDHVVTPRFNVNVQTTKAVEIEDESLVPPEYRRTIITQTVNKTSIRLDIEKGAEIPGARLVENKHIRIT